MKLYQILLRVVLTYLFMLILLRLSGKRVITEATSFNFVLAIMIGDLVDDMFLATVQVSQFIVAAGVLVLLQVIIAMGCLVSKTFSRIVDSRADLFMLDGRPVRPGMRRERMNEKDVEMMLRQQAGLEYERWAEVKSAHIERDGHPSVLKHEWAREAQQRERSKLIKESD